MKARNCFGTIFSGKCGDSFIAVSRGNVNYFRQYVKPRNPKTPEQVRHRAIFKEAVQAWRDLTDLQKAFYDGISEGMSGYNVFVGRYVKAVRNGGEPEVPTAIRWTVLNGKLPIDSDMVILRGGRQIFRVSLKDRRGEIALTCSDGPYTIAMDGATRNGRASAFEGLFEADAPIILEDGRYGVELRLGMTNHVEGHRDVRS